MKRIFTCLLMGLCMTVCAVKAQAGTSLFVFVDENGTVLEDGATVVRDVVELDAEGQQIIKSGISVKNNGASASDYLRVHYEVQQLDNGSYQICFPATCNYQSEVGSYQTGIGQLMGNSQDIMSEWFLEDDGTCLVKLTIETLVKQAGFPPQYETTGFGPTLTIKFVKGASESIPGDVNDDHEVNITDVNVVIDMILNPGGGNKKCDVNGDNEVNITDVNALIDIILNTN